MDLNVLRKAVESTLETNATKTVHNTVYPAISPLRPELNQAGRTVLITGGGTGVGLAMGKAFVAAKAARVVIVGRRESVLASARETLQQEAAKHSSPTTILSRCCDVTADDDVEKLWADAEIGPVHVLVLNAARFQEAPAPLVKLGYKDVWASFEANVKGPLHFAQRFSEQVSADGKPFPKVLLNVTTSAMNQFEKSLYPFPSGLQCYGLTKNSGALTLQLVAAAADPAELQVVTFHPGVLHSVGWEGMGVGPEDMPFDKFDLPGSFAVWLASPEARFLHGRYVWASWDVEELKSGDVRKRIDEDPEFLKIGVIGMRGNNVSK